MRFRQTETSPARWWIVLVLPLLILAAAGPASAWTSASATTPHFVSAAEGISASATGNPAAIAKGIGDLSPDNDLVFTSRHGSPLSPQNLLQRNFYPLLDRLGLPKIRFHDLRHTAATLLLAAGVHPKVVRRCSATPT